MLLGALAQESQGTRAIDLGTCSSFLFRTNVNTHTRTSYREGKKLSKGFFPMKTISSWCILVMAGSAPKLRALFRIEHREQ